MQDKAKAALRGKNSVKCFSYKGGKFSSLMKFSISRLEEEEQNKVKAREEENSKHCRGNL